MGAERAPLECVAAKEVPEEPQPPTDRLPAQEDRQVSMVMLQANTETLQRLTARLEQQHSAKVKAIGDQVSTLQTWLMIMVMLIVAVVTRWVVL